MSDPLLAALADAYFDDELDAVGAASLDAALHQDAAFRAWFAAQCRREVALRAVVQREHQARLAISGPQPVLGPGTDRVGRPPGSGSRWRRAGSSRRWRRPARSPQAIFPFLAAAAVFAAAILGGILSRPAPTTVATDAVAVVLTAASTERLRPGDRLRAADRVAAAHAMSLRYLAQGATLTLTATTQGEFRRDGFILVAGAVQVDLPAQTSGQAFRIVTAQAEVDVVGTSFLVTVVGDRTSVQVHSGSVGWTTALGRRLIRAGESAHYPPLPSAPLPDAAAPPEPAAWSRGIIGLHLIAAPTGEPVAGPAALRDGMRLSLPLLASDFVAIRADVTPAVQAVVITVDGPTHADKLTQVEAIPPFTYPGDKDGVIETSWRLQAGIYRVQAQGFADTRGREPLGDRYDVTFTVVDGE